MLRLIDTFLLTLSRRRPWARERVVYRALALVAADRPLPRTPR